LHEFNGEWQERQDFFMRQVIALCFAFVLCGCVAEQTVQQDYSRYSCQQLATEIRYVERQREATVIAMEKHSVVEDVGVTFLSLGTNAIPADESFYGKSDIARRLKQLDETKSNLERMRNAKCKKLS
jgi:hypothetical protein